MGPDTGGLRAFGEKRGIKTFAYGALGEPAPADELLASPVLRRIGDAHGRGVEEASLTQPAAASHAIPFAHPGPLSLQGGAALGAAARLRGQRAPHH